MTIAAHAGHLRIQVGRILRYALGDARPRPGAPSLGVIAMSLPIFKLGSVV